MEFIRDDQADIAKQRSIGGKCRNLLALQDMDIRIPSWIVIPSESLEAIVPGHLWKSDNKSIDIFLDNFEIPAMFIDLVLQHFKPNTTFAVRSSAIDEDGSEHSFAGQFESHMFVTAQQLPEAIKKVWRSAFSERVATYRNIHHLEHQFGIAVIVQEMINSDVAGVGFGINPLNGDRNAKLISAVFGLGEGLVSGELNADHFNVKDGHVESNIVPKEFAMVRENQLTGGLKKISLPGEKQNQPTLNEKQLLEVAELIDKCSRHFGKPQDIEFAYEKEVLYLLQSRPVTNLNRIPDKNANNIVWDNSNIIESYPGISSPLTFSFISRSYEGAYKLFCEFMGVDKTTIEKHERVFKNTLGYIRGRVYYNLRTWYHMLAMLPGYSINARFMEKMMGVKEKFDVPEEYSISKTAAWWRLLKMVVRMFRRFKSLPIQRKKFMLLLNDTIAHYKAIDLSKHSINELMDLYIQFENKLLNQWKAPLLNDFFAMIWFGRLQKQCEKYVSGKYPNIHNDLLCGSNDIISTQPVHRSIALASTISSDMKLKEMFIQNDEIFIWKYLLKSQNNSDEILFSEIQRYINDFGERCIGELKLETISYTQDPLQFISVLKSYVQAGIIESQSNRSIEDKLRTDAENIISKSMRFNPYRKYRFNKTLRRTRELVSARENLRYERTRAFGIVREIFSHLGKKFYSENILDHPRDIFFLTKDEIFAYIEGTSVTTNIRDLVSLRKKEHELFASTETPAERFRSYGPVYHANDFFDATMHEPLTGDLKGTGCCPGHITARVRVVMNPKEIKSLNGDILVTSSTDPGWVTLFPSASAILVERGSLLSHSAIVSREMGKPCIVGITGLLKTLKTGDIVEMDGGSGVIKIIKQNHE